MTALQIQRRALLSGGLACLALPALAAKLPLDPVTETQGDVTLTTRDLSLRFLDFYQAARDADPDARFAIWQERYGFAAVPPTPDGDKIARRLLDDAWPRYEAALPVIEAGAAGMTPRPIDVAVRVAGALAARGPLKIGFIAYVGGFETNAFTNSGPDGPVVAAPIEMDPEARALILPHEMTHAVHALTAGLSRGYERTLGRVVFEEGLAMRVTQRLQPGRQDYAYVGEKTWFQQAMSRRRQIMAALKPVLTARDSASVFKFTTGRGATGLEREAYIAGWLAVGRLMEEGASLPKLARLAEADLPAIVGETFSNLNA